MANTSNFELRTLITGATGFIGQHLTRLLVEAGAEVWAGVFPEESPNRVGMLPGEAERVMLDVRDAESVTRALDRSQPEMVFHLAAVGATDPGIPPLPALRVNVEGTIHLLEALRERGVRRVVLVGTCYEYGAREAQEGLDPFNFYAASKAAAWAFARAYWRRYDLPVVTVRLFQVYGPGQPAHTLIPAAIRAALAGEDFRMTLGEQQRDFIYVGDVVKGLMAAANAPSIEGESLDLGTGTVHPVRQAVEKIWELTGAQSRILAGAIPYRPGEVMHLSANADRTARLTGWRAAVSLEEGLRRTIGKIRRGRDLG